MACLQEKQAGTVQVVDGCGSVALYARTEGCDLLTIYNQHADVVVTRVVLPDSPRKCAWFPDEPIEQVARRQGANVFATAKKARPHFGSRAKSVLEERRCCTSPRPSARESCRTAHLRRAFAANSKYDKIVMPSPHTLGVAYVRLSEVAISFQDRTM